MAFYGLQLSDFVTRFAREDFNTKVFQEAVGAAVPAQVFRPIVACCSLETVSAVYAREYLQHVLCDCRRNLSETQSLKASLHLQWDSSLVLRHILGTRKSVTCKSRASKALLMFLQATSLNETGKSQLRRTRRCTHLASSLLEPNALRRLCRACNTARACRACSVDSRAAPGHLRRKCSSGVKRKL